MYKARQTPIIFENICLHCRNTTKVTSTIKGLYPFTGDRLQSMLATYGQGAVKA